MERLQIFFNDLGFQFLWRRSVPVQVPVLPHGKPAGLVQLQFNKWRTHLNVSSHSVFNFANLSYLFLFHFALAQSHLNEMHNSQKQLIEK